MSRRCVIVAVVLCLGAIGAQSAQEDHAFELGGAYTAAEMVQEKESVKPISDGLVDAIKGSRHGSDGVQVQRKYSAWRSTKAFERLYTTAKKGDEKNGFRDHFRKEKTIPMTGAKDINIQGVSKYQDVGQAEKAAYSSGKGKGKRNRAGKSKSKTAYTSAAYSSAEAPKPIKPKDPASTHYNIQLSIMYQEKVASTLAKMKSASDPVEKEVEEEKLVAYQKALASACKDVVGGSWTQAAYSSTYSSAKQSVTMSVEQSMLEQTMTDAVYDDDTAVVELGADDGGYSSSYSSSSSLDSYRQRCLGFLKQQKYSSG